jgi:hypothetical protein
MASSQWCRKAALPAGLERTIEKFKGRRSVDKMEMAAFMGQGMAESRSKMDEKR